MSLLLKILLSPFVGLVLIGYSSYLGYEYFTDWEQNTYQGILNETDALRLKRDQKKAEVKAAEEFSIQKQAKLQELRDLQTKLDATKSEIPRSVNVSELLKALADRADKAGLGFTRFRPEAGRRNNFLVETPIAVDLTGTYAQMMSFMDDIANMTRIVATEVISLRPLATGATGRSLTGQQNLQATVKIVSYHLDEAAFAQPMKKDPPAPGQGSP